MNNVVIITKGERVAAVPIKFLAESVGKCLNAANVSYKRCDLFVNNEKVHHTHSVNHLDFISVVPRPPIDPHTPKVNKEVNILIRIAKLGDRVIELACYEGTIIKECLNMAGIYFEGMTIRRNGNRVTPQCRTHCGDVIILQPSMKGG